jgi:type IV fimbrial biogenesis protein FimT
MSLLELLVVLAILAILGALVATNQAQAYRKRAALAELRGFLERARLEAVRREAMVAVVQEGEDLLACLDTNADGRCQAGETPLARFRPRDYRGEVRLRTGIQPGLRFNALGRPFTGGRVELWLGGSATSFCLTLGGRIREVAGDAC